MKNKMKIIHFKFGGYDFILQYLHLQSSRLYWNVIKKGRGIRPVEALATLVLPKLRPQEGATFY